MKDSLIFLLISILYLSFKSTILPTLPTPDIPLIIVFYIAYTKADISAVILSFVIGYLDDVLSGSIIGTTSFTLVFIFTANSLIARRMEYSNISSRALGCAIASLIKGSLSFIIWRSVSPDISYFSRVIPTVIVTALFAPFILSLFERFHRKRGHENAGGGVS